MADTGERPRVLFVDDEENLLHGILRQVRGIVAAELTTSSVEAAGMLEQSVADGHGGYAVVVSDMRMPEMDGAALLEYSRTVCPDTTRLLLTGYADVDSAIAAVNDGNIFRFLTKPCPTLTLRSALIDAIDHHQLLMDRRELLELTLRGAIEALVDTLAMTHPAAFARASRLRRLVRAVAERLELSNSWQIEVAAQLGEIGVVTLPPEALEALTKGTPTNAAVARMLQSLPAVADEVLGRIPRMDAVREIVREQQPVDHPDLEALAHAQQPVRVLQAIREFDAMMASGHQPQNAIGILRQRAYHDAEVVDALAAVVSVNQATEIREVELAALTPGLVMAADLRTSAGMLLASHGHVLTPELLARIRNFASLGGLDGVPIIQVRNL